MTREEILTKRYARLEEKEKDLAERVKASKDADEVRALGKELEDVRADMKETRGELDALAAQMKEESKESEEKRESVPEDAKLVNGTIKGSFVPKTSEGEERTMLETMEYRKAFKNFVQKRTPIPMELRTDEASTTTDTAAAIPLTVMNEIINTVRKKYGNLYAKVRKTAVKGGVQYPIGALEATFHWINEEEVSPRQKAGSLSKVTFSYHTAEIRVAQTFLSQVVTIEDFERKVVELIARAYLQAMDYGIVNGSGDGQMLGILNDARVTNVVTMNASQINDWVAWRKRFFAKLPLGYRAGEFIFPVSTVDAYLETMADANNNPVFRQATGLEVNDGDAANPNGRFFGREISLVEEDIIPDFDTASAGDVIGVYWQPEEYAINENFGFTFRQYFDEETNEWVNKAIVVVDGKVLNPSGYVLIKKA